MKLQLLVAGELTLHSRICVDLGSLANCRVNIDQRKPFPEEDTLLEVLVIQDFV